LQKNIWTLVAQTEYSVTTQQHQRAMYTYIWRHNAPVHTGLHSRAENGHNLFLSNTTRPWSLRGKESPIPWTPPTNEEGTEAT